ncbi:uncharacterized protein LOC135128815 [Zophobas morio]|uniref:uncharacterized protein LOC135128815 n=1 Tax=Zophobas morio TaxID=2755281 RepID=UPI003082D022
MVIGEKDKLNNQPISPSIPYREAIGSLFRFNGKAMMSHLRMVKRIFQYLKGTSNHGIFFNGSDTFVAYSDSHYGGDPETKHSTTGVLVMRGGPIVWYTQKQRLVATSTAEAEYRAAVSAIDDVCWIKRIYLELEIVKEDKPIELLIDNQTAIHMMYNAHEGKPTKGKKHIEIPRRFIQKHVDKTVTFKHVDSGAFLFNKETQRKLNIV